MLAVPQPYGEIVDRLVILDLKCARFTEPARLEAVRRLRAAIAERWAEAGLPPIESLPEHEGLCEVNAELWALEDAVREHEARGVFDGAFVEAARRIYLANDRRAALKGAVDRRLGSVLSEPKGHRLQTGT